ncbi:MAG: zinc ribbon domain-containing protein [Anaerolineales bacterium]|jgi:putative FmdB family regulatory protein
MPVYEYVCEDCGREFDALRAMQQADAPLRCEACGGEHNQRKLSLFFAQSSGRSVPGTSAGSCAGCAGGSCSTCSN